jgi:hypothetical protein
VIRRAVADLVGVAALGGCLGLLWVGVAGAIFAAIRLGIVALPEIRKRSARANPGARRRRRLGARLSVSGKAQLNIIATVVAHREHRTASAALPCQRWARAVRRAAGGLADRCMTRPWSPARIAHGSMHH